MELSKSHPIVILLFFLSNIIITMLTKNPLFITISFTSVVIYSFVLKKPKNIIKTILLITIILVISALTNPLFSNYGETILFSIGKKDFDLESMLYGLFTGLMLVSIILWFRNYNILMTSDKFRYLFSKYMPQTALIISLILKLVPELISKMKDFNNGQKITGFYYNQTFFGKLRSRFNTLGNLFSWSIEYSMQTAISMKARGYELNKKTRFIIYKFKTRDILTTLLIVLSFISILILGYNSIFNFSYYPVLDSFSLDFKNIVAYSVFIILANLATIIHVKESIKWHYLQSKIYHLPTH